MYPTNYFFVVMRVWLKYPQPPEQAMAETGENNFKVV